jgi:hypothetical protein
MANQTNIQLCYNRRNYQSMAQTTYADVLQYFGLENWQFIALACFLLALWSLLTVLYKVGAIKKVQVDKMRLSSF